MKKGAMLLVRQLKTAVLGHFPSTNTSYSGTQGVKVCVCLLHTTMLIF